MARDLMAVVEVTVVVTNYGLCFYPSEENTRKLEISQHPNAQLLLRIIGKMIVNTFSICSGEYLLGWLCDCAIVVVALSSAVVKKT